MPGVADAEKFINSWTRWNRLDGAQETVQVVGFNPDRRALGMWWREASAI